MGVTSRRIGMVALVALSVFLAVRKPDGSRPVSSTPAVEWRRMFQLQQAAENASRRWSMLALRDSAIAAIKAMETGGPAGAAPTIIFRGFAHADSSPNARGTITRAWRAIGTPDARVRTILIIYNPMPFEYGIYDGALITERGATTWCVAMAGGRASLTGSVRAYEYTLDNAIAPCALLATFGPPGPTLSAWLTRTRYAAAASSDWLVRPPDFNPDRGPWALWRDDESMAALDRNTEGPLVRAAGIIGAGVLRPTPYVFGLTGLQCMQGRGDACVRAVLHAGVIDPDSGIVPDDLTLPARTLAPDSVTSATVRLPSSNFTSGIIAAFGRERFRTFWRSSAPFEEAFADAFGEPLGAWTARWSQRLWHGSFEARYGGASLMLGTAVQLAWLPLIPVWSALCVLITMWVAQRRKG